MTNKFSAALRLSALPFLCVLSLTASPHGAASAQKRAPRFADYPVKEVYKGRNARVVLTNDSWSFRTRLREAA
jgi:hypothetical protein